MTKAQQQATQLEVWGQLQPDCEADHAAARANSPRTVYISSPTDPSLSGICYFQDDPPVLRGLWCFPIHSRLNPESALLLHSQLVKRLSDEPQCSLHLCLRIAMALIAPH